MDTDNNVGLIIRYRPDSRGKLVRRNTRALDSEAGNDQSKETQKAQKPDAAGRFLAFKALPARSSVPVSSEDTVEDEGEIIKSVCDEIARVANGMRREEGEGDRKVEIEDKDIISLADAKKSTSYLEQFEYSLKKLVWG